MPVPSMVEWKVKRASGESLKSKSDTTKIISWLECFFMMFPYLFLVKIT